VLTPSVTLRDRDAPFGSFLQSESQIARQREPGWSPLSGASGDPAVVSVWERYEDTVNMHLLVRGDDGPPPDPSDR
jgi:hypothetical protein